MEAPQKSSSKTLVDNPSPAKTTSKYAKTAKKGGAKDSPAKSSGQNGVGVSPSRKEGALGDGFGLQGLGVDALDDSDMNGVSSLLKMQESESLKGLGPVLDFISRNENKEVVVGDGGDGGGAREMGGFSEQNEDVGGVGEEDGGGDEEGGFGVGDFVWGKIRSHPWWPGRVYDPLDASDYAKRVKHTDKILVAYFGDRTFAWCHPSQLIPFEENFSEMSSQSHSRSFVNAVEEAVNEVGRLVDLKMTCACVPKDNLIGFGRTLVVNAGIKEGLLVPEAGIDKFSTSLFEPAEFLPTLKHIAQIATIPNMLEFSVLKNCLSAFYRAKGGCELPKYYEPLPVPGLEDDTRNWAVDFGNYNSGVEVAVHGPVEDWSSSLLSPQFGQNDQSLIQRCAGITDDRQYHRRKQKSIAQILAGQTDAEGKEPDVALTEKKRGKNKTVRVDTNAAGEMEVEGVTKVRANSGKHASSSGRKKRKESDDTDGVGLLDLAETGIGLDSGRKKRRVSVETVGGSKNSLGLAAEAGANFETAASSAHGEKRNASAEDNVDGGSGLKIELKTMEQKQFSESLVGADIRIASLEANNSKKGSSKNPQLKGGKKRGSVGIENDSKGEQETAHTPVSAGQSMDGGLSSQTVEGLASRERKKSKYLSPPFTDIKRGHSKKELEEGSQKMSDEAQIGDQMTKAPDHFDGSSSTLKSFGEKSRKRQTMELSPGRQASGKLDTESLKQYQIDPTKLEPPANEMLSYIRSAALDPTYLQKENSLDLAEGFFSAFRSSICSNGSDYELYKKHQSGRKRKSQESESSSPREEQNLADLISPSHKSQTRRKRKNEAAKFVKLKDNEDNEAASVPNVKANELGSGWKAPAASLIVTFGPGSSLPSKNDLTEIYGRFGALDEEETEVLVNQRNAKIVFLSSSEAEEAFNASQRANPLGTPNTTFQLRYLSTNTNTRDLKEISSSQHSPLAEKGGKTPDNQAPSQASASNLQQLNYIKQRLELMTSMLSDGKMSPGAISRLQAEMKSLLEEVSAMTGSSSQKVNLP
ncbi:hypothetical protein Tsubulata_004739 [Turnera subulata]|uniref:PWWP domain-containing protein n=1 Tax=Turnera subulata TaxID=218843 RepID=A0A9Q0FHJ2_9ROSI|nr:hypothetical protein Tsubulata_004739 [Turnera subulata]